MKDRFEKFVKVSGGTSCHIWQGYCGKDGYGRFRVADKKIGSHRVAYMLYTGEIPDGMEIHHKCFNPACVNPDHLELVTPQENKKKRKIRVDKVCRNGHSMTDSNTIRRKDGSVKCRKCDNTRQREWVKNKRNLA